MASDGDTAVEAGSSSNTSPAASNTSTPMSLASQVPSTIKGEARESLSQDPRPDYFGNRMATKSNRPQVHGRYSTKHRRPRLPQRNNMTTQHPQLGWTDEEYRERNPWFGQSSTKPVFSLGKPLPHVVRRKTDAPGQKAKPNDVEANVPENEEASNAQDRAGRGQNLSKPLSGLSQISRKLGKHVSHDLREAPSKTTAAGVAHSNKRNDAGQPVFDYMPGQNGNDSRSRLDSMEDLSEQDSGESSPAQTGAEFKIDGEPLGQPERSEVEEGERDPNELRNGWARFRVKHREMLAEYLSTLVAVFLGLAGTLSVNLSANQASPYGSYETSCWAWGFAWMFGIYLGGGISGAHLNPAISISLSIFRGFPWRQCALYVIAQFAASITAGALAYGVFADTIYHKDPSLSSTSEAFFSTPQEWVSVGSAFANQVVGSAVVMIAIFALGDDQNNPPGAGMHAFVLGLLVTMMKMSLGYNIGSALNPASDFGPRIIAYAIGCPAAFTDTWWLYGPWMATIIGSIVGCTLYDGMIFVGTESPVNYRYNMSGLKERSTKLFRFSK